MKKKSLRTLNLTPRICTWLRAHIAWLRGPTFGSGERNDRAWSRMNDEEKDTARTLLKVWNKS